MLCKYKVHFKENYGNKFTLALLVETPVKEKTNIKAK